MQQYADPRTVQPARAQLRRLLLQHAKRVGWTDAAIDTLVDRAEITYPSGRFPLCTSTERRDFLPFLISGVAKVLCHPPNRDPITVQFVGPGGFLCVPPGGKSPGLSHVSIVPHEDPVVALIPRNIASDVVGRLPAGRVALLVSCTWRRVSRRLFAKCALLGLPLREQIVSELYQLSRDLGRETAAGILIDTSLTHDDIAGLIAASRSSVSRCMVVLRRHGYVRRMGHKLLVNPALFSSPSTPRLVAFPIPGEDAHCT